MQRGLAAHAQSLPLAWVNEHTSSWAAGERWGLQGDRSGRLDSAAAAVLLEQWLREGPEPVSLQDSVDPRGAQNLSGGEAADPAAS